MENPINWKDCNKKHFVKEKRPNKDFENSCVKIAKRKNAASDLLEKFPEEKFILKYDAIRILLSSIASSRGLQILNHKCITFFIENELSSEDIARKFNILRKHRNNLNYIHRDSSVNIDKLIKLADALFIQLKINN